MALTYVPNYFEELEKRKKHRIYATLLVLTCLLMLAGALHLPTMHEKYTHQSVTRINPGRYVITEKYIQPDCFRWIETKDNTKDCATQYQLQIDNNHYITVTETSYENISVGDTVVVDNHTNITKVIPTI